MYRYDILWLYRCRIDILHYIHLTFVIIQHKWKKAQRWQRCSFELKTPILSEISILPDSECTGCVCVCSKIKFMKERIAERRGVKIKCHFLTGMSEN